MVLLLCMELTKDLWFYIFNNFQEYKIIAKLKQFYGCYCIIISLVNIFVNFIATFLIFSKANLYNQLVYFSWKFLVRSS